MISFEAIDTLRLQGRADEALALLDGYSESGAPCRAWAQQGLIAASLGRYDLANRLLKAAYPLFDEPYNQYIILNKLATNQYAAGRFDQARQYFLNIRKPEWLRTFYELHAGYFPDDEDFASIQTRMITDDDISGRRIAIMSEGGIGDHLWFCRYAAQLKEQGAAEVCLMAPPQIHGMLNSCRGIDLVSSNVVPGPHWDAAAWLLTLFARCQKTPYVPSHPPYLGAPDLGMGAAAVRNQFPALGGRPRVGLVWRSSTVVGSEPYRSMPLSALSPVLESCPVDWIVLQPGPLTGEEASLINIYDITRLDLNLETFDEIANALQHLDMVVTVDTAVGHLAGAMGIPCCLLLSAVCDHRWYADQEYTPWYPRHRLFRQDRLGHWAEPMARLAEFVASL